MEGQNRSYNSFSQECSSRVTVLLHSAVEVSDTILTFSRENGRPPLQWPFQNPKKGIVSCFCLLCRCAWMCPTVQLHLSGLFSISDNDILFNSRFLTTDHTAYHHIIFSL